MKIEGNRAYTYIEATAEELRTLAKLLAGLADMPAGHASARLIVGSPEDKVEYSVHRVGG